MSAKTEREMPFEDIRETKLIKRAEQLYRRVLNAPPSQHMGIITGEPGTGKTTASFYLAEKFNGIRVSAYKGMEQKHLVTAICKAAGRYIPHNLPRVPLACEEMRKRLLIIDEANHLRIQPLEFARFLADEEQTAVILVGTPQLTEYMDHPQVRRYAVQLQQRIGTKRLALDSITPTETALHVLAPAFGEIDQELATQFHRYAEGNWRLATALLDGCQELMRNNAITAMSAEVLDATYAEMRANPLWTKVAIAS